MTYRTVGWSAALLLAIGGLGLAGAAAQEPLGETVTEQIDVREVLLDVLVTDARKRVIVGLGKDDFRVHENGEEMEIASVTFYSSRRLLDSAEGLEGSIDTVPRERYFIFFFQDQRRDGVRAAARQLEAGRDAVRWIDEELGERDFAAVAAWDVKLEIHQDFTNDREALRAAVERAAQGRDAGGNWPSRQPALDEGPSLSRQLPAGRELRKATRTIYRALGELAEAAGSIHGRKVMLFFGRGFGRLDDRGLYERENIKIGPMLDRLNDNNVAVYALDATPRGYRHSMERSLEELGSATGGEYLRLFTSFITPLRRVADANGGYYLLSYRGRHPAGERGFQRVKVEAVNPELKVSARRGYLYGESDG